MNGEVVDGSYLLRNNDKLVHRVRREEREVLSRKVRIIEETKDFVVVEKPASLPIHPCGGYRFNSLIEILKYQY